MILTPTYHVMEMYNVHQDATLLPVNINTDDYAWWSEICPRFQDPHQKISWCCSYITYKY